MNAPCLILFFVFLVLKLLFVIKWSWWWVTAPLWVPVACFPVLIAALFLVVTLIVLIAWFFGYELN